MCRTFNKISFTQIVEITLKLGDFKVNIPFLFKFRSSVLNDCDLEGRACSYECSLQMNVDQDMSCVWSLEKVKSNVCTPPRFKPARRSSSGRCYAARYLPAKLDKRVGH